MLSWLTKRLLARKLNHRDMAVRSGALKKLVSRWRHDGRALAVLVETLLHHPANATKRLVAQHLLADARESANPETRASLAGSLNKARAGECLWEMALPQPSPDPSRGSGDDLTSLAQQALDWMKWVPSAAHVATAAAHGVPAIPVLVSRAEGVLRDFGWQEDVPSYVAGGYKALFNAVSKFLQTDVTAISNEELSRISLFPKECRWTMAFFNHEPLIALAQQELGRRDPLHEVHQAEHEVWFHCNWAVKSPLYDYVQEYDFSYRGVVSVLRRQVSGHEGAIVSLGRAAIEPLLAALRDPNRTRHRDNKPVISLVEMLVEVAAGPDFATAPYAAEVIEVLRKCLAAGFDVGVINSALAHLLDQGGLDILLADLPAVIVEHRSLDTVNFLRLLGPRAAPVAPTLLAWFREQNCGEEIQEHLAEALIAVSGNVPPDVLHKANAKREREKQAEDQEREARARVREWEEEARRNPREPSEEEQELWRQRNDPDYKWPDERGS